MPEPQSALAAQYAVGRCPAGAEPGVYLREITGWDLVQVAAWQGRQAELYKAASAALDVAPPSEPNRWAAGTGVELLTVAPARLWCITPEDDDRLRALAAAIDVEFGCVTQLGHSHVRVRIEGPGARGLLAQELAIDLSPVAFPTGHIARTAMHHVPVTLQCLAAQGSASFDLYMPRTFAASLWSYLLDLGLGVGYEVLPVMGVDDLDRG